MTPRDDMQELPLPTVITTLQWQTLGFLNTLMAADVLQRPTAEQAFQHEFLSGTSLSGAKKDMQRLLPNYDPCIDLLPIVAMGQAPSPRAGLQGSHDSGALHSAANMHQGSAVQPMSATSPPHLADSTQAVRDTNSVTKASLSTSSTLSGVAVSTSPLAHLGSTESEHSAEAAENSNQLSPALTAGRTSSFVPVERPSGNR